MTETSIIVMRASVSTGETSTRVTSSAFGMCEARISARMTLWV